MLDACFSLFYYCPICLASPKGLPQYDVALPCLFFLSLFFLVWNWFLSLILGLQKGSRSAEQECILLQNTINLPSPKEKKKKKYYVVDKIVLMSTTKIPRRKTGAAAATTTTPRDMPNKSFVILRNQLVLIAIGLVLSILGIDQILKRVS